MVGFKRILAAGYWIFAALTFAAAIVLVFAWTPEEATMGPIQKIFYFHLPIAINTGLACFVAFVASIGYIAQRRTWWDDLAASAAHIAVLLCSGVLITGMIWARGAWGVWWTWSPRLTFSFMLWLLYVVYLLVRASIESSQRRAIVSAVYAIVAFLNVPLVYLSANMLKEVNDIHPSSISLAPAMKLTLALCFVPITLLAAGLLVVRFKLARAERAQRSALAEANAEHGFPVILSPGAA